MRRIGLLILLIAAVTGCAAAPEITATPTETPTITPLPTQTPPPEPTPLPSVLELTRATDPSQQAFLSVVHAAFDVPIFDVYVERLAIATNLNFGQFTQPSGIVAGDYFLRVVPNGVRPDAGEILYETPIALKGGDSLLLIFSGQPNNMLMSYFQMPLDPLDAEQSRVTIIHALPDGPEITVQQNGVPLTSPIPFGSAGFPIVLPPGETTLELQSGGSTLLAHPINLVERFSYILVIAGSTSDLETLRVIETRSSVPGRANIRAMNAASAIGPVDIYLDDLALAANLDYTRVSNRQGMAAQVYTVRVFPAGADRDAMEPLLRDQLVANNDDFITLLLTGSAQNLRLIVHREDRSLLAPDYARVTFANTLEQVSSARIETQVSILDEIGELGYGQPPRSIDLTAGTYRFVWMRMENGHTTEAVEIANDVVLEPGFSYLYPMTGRLDAPPIILGDNIGIDPGLGDLPEGQLPTPTPDIPTQVRFINAIKGGLPFDAIVDGQTLTAGLSYGSSSTPINIDPGDHTIEIRSSSQTLVSLDTALEVSRPYAIIAFGFGTDPVELLIVDDSGIFQSGEPPHFRIINLTMAAELKLSLAVSRAESAASSTTIFSESPGSEIFRRSFSYGIDPIRNVDDTVGRAYSNVALAPIGPHDVHVVDTGLSMIAASYRQLDLQPGVHYDIIAFQNLDTMLVEGFAVRYPGA